MGNANSVDQNQDNPEFQWLQAVNNGETTKVQEMLRADPEIVFRAQTKDNQSAWHFAAQAGQLKVLEILHSPGVPLPPRPSLKRGSQPLGNLPLQHRTFSVNQQDKKGSTPLILASADGHAECVTFLLKIGADPTLACHNGTRCIHHAAKGNHVAVINAILDHEGPAVAGVDPNRRMVDARNKVGLTPLHFAVYFSHVDSARALIQHGARLTAQSKVDSLDIVTCNGGSTPLHVAALRDNIPMINLLLEQYVQAAGAKDAPPMPDLRTIPDNYRLVPLQIAQNMKITTTTAVLDPAHALELGPAPGPGLGRSISVKGSGNMARQVEQCGVEMQGLTVHVDATIDDSQA